MKNILFFLTFTAVIFTNCTENEKNMGKKIKVLYLHHSTGEGVFLGGVNRYISKLTNKSVVQTLLQKENKKNKSEISIEKQAFPKSEPYGWNNYPYDYYNLWVKNAGEKEYMEEPTLEILTKEYDIISLKHCFPASNILEDDSLPSIDSDKKTLSNYKLQYNALKEKFHQFPKNKFIIWTPPALVQNNTTEENAKRANEFTKWVLEEWDEPNDNIFVWDFRNLETEGALYLPEKYAAGSNNSHPNNDFNKMAAASFVDFLIKTEND